MKFGTDKWEGFALRSLNPPLEVEKENGTKLLRRRREHLGESVFREVLFIQSYINLKKKRNLY